MSAKENSENCCLSADFLIGKRRKSKHYMHQAKQLKKFRKHMTVVNRIEGAIGVRA